MMQIEVYPIDDGTDTIYEFEDGKLLLMTAESEINRQIAMFILVHRGVCMRSRYMWEIVRSLPWCLLI
jgi:hypothetical protein